MKKLILFLMLACLPVFADRIFLVVLNPAGGDDGGGGEPSEPVVLAYTLPTYQVVQVTETRPEASTPFSFDSETNEASAGVPLINEWTRFSDPSDVMMVTAEGMSATNMLAVFTDSGTNSYAGEILGLEDRQLAVRIPSELNSNDACMLWLFNENGFSEPVPFNTAQADWCGFNNIFAGEKFYIYGKSLTLDGTNAYCYISELDLWVTNSGPVNPFKAGFYMPESATNGTYTLYAFNGHGGKYGLSDPVTLDVISEYTYTGVTNSVLTYGANGSDTNYDDAAFESAIVASSVGDTIYIPDGTYLFQANIDYDDKRLIWQGESQAGTILESAGRTNNSGIFQGSSSGASGTKLFDLTIHDTYENQTASFYGMNRIHIERVTISQLDAPAWGMDWSGFGFLNLQNTDNVHITNCTLITANGVTFQSTDYPRIEDTAWYGVNDCNALSGGIGLWYSDINNCSFNHWNAENFYDGFGWGKGRLIVCDAGDYVYFGENRITNMAPREPTSWLTNSIVTNFTQYAGNAEMLAASVDVYQYSTSAFPVVFYFDDIPDEYDGRGDNGVTYSGVTISYPMDPPIGQFTAFSGLVSETDAISNTITAYFHTWKTQHYWNVVSPPNYAICKDIVDQNSGEQLLFEGLQSVQQGKPSAATSNTLTLATTEWLQMLATNETTLVITTNGCREVAIISGRGMGQSRKVSGIYDQVLTLDKNWRTIPDTNSIYQMKLGADNTVVYGNYFSGLASGIGYDHKATTSVQMSGSHGHVFKNNTLYNMRTLHNLYGHSGQNTRLAPHAVPAVAMFAILEDNVATNTSVGFQDLLIPANTGLLEFDEARYTMGNVYRNNRVTNTVYQSAFSTTSTCTNSLGEYSGHGMSAYDGNVITGFGVSSNASTYYYPKALRFMDNDPIVLSDNVSTGGPMNYGLSGAQAYLYNNSWNSFGTNYEDSVAAYVQIPKATITVGADSTNSVTIYNTGSSNVSWTASEGAAWLTVTASGNVSAESSDTITCTVSGASSNDMAQVTVIGDANTNFFNVVVQ